jgi:hypothetical protein
VEEVITTSRSAKQILMVRVSDIVLSQDRRKVRTVPEQILREIKIEEMDFLFKNTSNTGMLNEVLISSADTTSLSANDDEVGC